MATPSIICGLYDTTRNTSSIVVFLPDEGMTALSTTPPLIFYDTVGNNTTLFRFGGSLNWSPQTVPVSVCSVPVKINRPPRRWRRRRRRVLPDVRLSSSIQWKMRQRQENFSRHGVESRRVEPSLAHTTRNTSIIFCPMKWYQHCPRSVRYS